MKRISPNLSRLQALYGFAGLVFGAAVANAATVYSNGFEGAEAAALAAGEGPGASAGQYVYGNRGGWTQIPGGDATNTAWWYSTNYATVTSPVRADPFGNVAWHMRSQYAYRVLTDTFAGGATYEMSVMAATIAGDTVGTRNLALYLWDGDGAIPLSWDGSAAAGANFYPAGSATPYLAGTYVANAAFIATPDYQTPAGNNAGNWQELKFQFTAPAALDGRHIGIAVFGRNNVAIDNLLLTVPEPGSAATLTGSLALLMARRRRK